VQAFFDNLWATDTTLFVDIFRRILTAIVIIVIGKVLVTIGQKFILKIAEEKFNLEKAVASILGVVLQYGMLIICAIMILENFGVNTASLIALLGTAGVAVGLALKDTLSNIAAGIILLFLKPFKVGDFIEFGSFMGAVKEIGLFATQLETGDGVFIAAPNSSLWGVPLKNYSRNTKRRMDLAISISYSDSIDKAFEVLQSVIDAESRFLKDPAPAMMVSSLGDSGINITLRAWATSDVYWPCYWFQIKNVKEKIEEAGLTIPFPQSEVRIVENSSVAVKTSGEWRVGSGEQGAERKVESEDRD
jgi:small conductance mechanosensitive channel